MTRNSTRPESLLDAYVLRPRDREEASNMGHNIRNTTTSSSLYCPIETTPRSTITPAMI